MNIGKIKWFGGYNSKNDTYNKHGFIENIKNQNSEYININNVNKKSVFWKYYKNNSNQLTEGNYFSGSFVLYDLDISNGKSRAINVVHLSEDKELISSNVIIESFGKTICDSPSFIFPYDITQHYIDIFSQNLNWFNSLNFSGKIDVCYYINLQQKTSDNSDIFVDTVSYYLQPKNTIYTYSLTIETKRKLHVILKTSLFKWEDKIMSVFNNIISQNARYKIPMDIIETTSVLFVKNPNLLKFMDINTRISLWCTFFRDKVWDNEKNYLTSLYQIYKDIPLYTDSPRIFHNSLKNEPELLELAKEIIVKNINNINIYSLLDIKRKFDLLIYALNNNIWAKQGINSFIHLLFKEALASHHPHLNNLKEKMLDWYQQIPQGIEINYEFAKYIGVEYVCDQIWQKEDCGIDYWDFMDVETKIKFIFKMSYTFGTKTLMYSKINKEKLHGLLNTEQSKLIQGVLFIFWEKYYRENGYFIRGHNLIEEYICEIADCKDIEDGDIYKFLYNITKACDLHITGYKGMPIHLCEGSLWYTKDGDIKTYCPRTRKKCHYSLLDTSLQIIGKHLHSWTKWNLHDLLRSGNIMPSVNGLEKPDEYMYKLNGWVNRICEIRARCKCSKCDHTLLANYAYAKLKAAYGMTVVKRCPDYSEMFLDVHDDQFYLNHCHGCNNVIDSRESPHQVDNNGFLVDKNGFYICISCGAGSYEFIPGSICPKCGKKDTELRDDVGAHVRCTNCGHEIIIASKYRDKTKKYFLNRSRSFNFEDGNIFWS